MDCLDSCATSPVSPTASAPGREGNLIFQQRPGQAVLLKKPQLRVPIIGLTSRARWKGFQKSTWSCNTSSNSVSSGESSSDDNSAHLDGNYWKTGVFIPQLLLLVCTAGTEQGVHPILAKNHHEARVPFHYSNCKDPPGIHMLWKLSERVLDGYFVDIFPFSSQKVMLAKEISWGTTECSFQNWHGLYHIHEPLSSWAWLPLHIQSMAMLNMMRLFKNGYHIISFTTGISLIKFGRLLLAHI